MTSILSALVGQLVAPGSKRPGTGAERQRKYKARYIEAHGKEAWDARVRANKERVKSCKG